MYLLDHPLDASRYYAERVGLSFRNRTLIVSEKIAGEGKENRAQKQADVEIRVVSRQQLDDLDYPDPGGWLTVAEARHWLDHGFGRLIAALQENEIVAYCWLETGVVHLDFFDMEAALASQDYYISKMYVAPKCRRGYLALTISKALAVEAMRVAETAGFRRGLIAHVPEQSAMKHVFKSLGWKAIRTVQYYRAGPLCWFHSSSPDGGRFVFGGRKMAETLFSAIAGTMRER